MTDDKRSAYNWILAHQDYPHEEWCLIWPFFRDKNGRAVIQTEGEHYAHRLMCKIAKGEPPTPEHGTAHSCGAGHLGCVNPHHLSWKTQAENLEDCAIHGTQPKHRLGPKGHFSMAEVEQIRRLLKTQTQLSIAQLYRVTESTISDIARGRYYSRPHKLNYWTPEEDAKIRDCVARGLSLPQMAKELGRSLGGTTGRVYRLGLTSGRKPTRSDYSTTQQRQESDAMDKLTKKRNAAAVACARKMHKECMQDPEYATRWRALVLAIGHLTDLPSDALDVTTDQ